MGERRAIMDDTKTTEPVKAADAQESSSAPGMTTAAESPKPPEPSDVMRITKLGEDIGEARTSHVADSAEAADDHTRDGSVPIASARPAAKFAFPLHITQQTWLIVSTLFLGVMALLIFSRTGPKTKAVAEVREEKTVEALTPENLLTKCGPPVEDVTKDLYPMIKRTMSYKPNGKGTLTFEFSRTSQEKSEWLFLSMSDENGATYATPETQTVAMPCLK
jgi:hypothetical protein